MSTKTNKRFQWDNVILISLAHLFHDTFSAFLAPVLPLIIEKLSISLTMSSFLNIAQRAPSLLNPYIGYISDKLKIRYLIIIAPALTATIMSLIGLAPTYTVLVLMLFAMGIGSSLFHVPSPVMIKKVSGSKPGMGMSFYMLGGELARTLGPLTILTAISFWTFEGTWRLIPLVIVLTILLWAKIRNISIQEEFKHNKTKTTPFSSLRKHKSFFIAISFFILFTSVLKSGISFFLPKYIIDQGNSLWVGGIALSIFQLSGALGTFLSGTISDFLGRRKTLLLSTITTPVLMYLFVVFSNSYIALPILILLGISTFANTPVILTMVTSLSDENTAFINSIYMTISFIIGSVAIVLVGIIGDQLGLANTFKLSAIVALGAIPFVFKLGKQ